MRPSGDPYGRARNSHTTHTHTHTHTRHVKVEVKHISGKEEGSSYPYRLLGLTRHRDPIPSRSSRREGIIQSYPKTTRPKAAGAQCVGKGASTIDGRILLLRIVTMLSLGHLRPQCLRLQHMAIMAWTCNNSGKRAGPPLIAMSKVCVGDMPCVMYST